MTSAATNTSQRNKMTLLVIDAENIQIRTWYKRIKASFVNRFTDIYKWNKIEKVAIYNKSNEATAERTWNDSIRSVVIDGDADDGIINFIIEWKKKHTNNNRIIIASNDKELVRRVTFLFKKNNVTQFYNNNNSDMSKELSIKSKLIKKSIK